MEYAITSGFRGVAKRLALGVAVALTALVPAMTNAQEAGDGKPWQDYYGAFAGKKVAFVPMALSFDIAQAYDGSMKAQADALGYTYEVRDPNWSVESAVQIAEQYLAEDPKPDIMVIHPLDDKAFLRVIKKAKDAGVYVIFMNLRMGAGTDSMGNTIYIGADHYNEGKKKLELAAQACANSESKKIAIIQAPLTNAVAIAETAGELEQLKLHPELNLVSMQSADADANKAKSIASTILKQNPDMCAIIGQWDGQDIGIPPAVAEAGLTGKVAVITSGSGSQPNACDKISDGTYTGYVSSNIADQTVILGATIKQLLQTKPPIDTATWSVYVDSPIITKDTMAKTPCWNLDYVTRSPM